MPRNNLITLIRAILSIALIAGGSYPMYLFFDYMGVAVFITMTAAIVGIVAIIQRSTTDTGGTPNPRRATRRSKGSQQNTGRRRQR